MRIIRKTELESYIFKVIVPMPGVKVFGIPGTVDVQCFVLTQDGNPILKM